MRRSRNACWSASRSGSHGRPCPRRLPQRRWGRAMHSRIVGTGGYLPAQILSNAELAKPVATSDEWIRSRTGIRQRHIAAPDEKTSDLALAAAREALLVAGIAPSA